MQAEESSRADRVRKALSSDKQARL